MRNFSWVKKYILNKNDGYLKNSMFCCSAVISFFFDPVFLINNFDGFFLLLLLLWKWIVKEV